MNTFHALMLTSLLAAAALIMVLGGCGGSSSASSQGALTKSQFIKRADAICVQSEGEQLQLMVAYAKHHPGAEEEEMVKPAGLPPLEKQLESIKALEAPAGDEAKVAAWLDEFEAQLQKAKKNPGSVLDLEHNPFATANKMAEKYGLKGCAGAP